MPSRRASARRGAATCRSTPSRAPTSSSSTPSASWPTVYQLGTVVFVGGSLVPTGGHNILEPAVFGRPVVFGPHMQNFAEIAAAFVANGAGVQVDDEGAFEAEVLALMTDSGAPGPARGGGPGSGRSQPRRQGQDAGGARRPAAAGAQRLPGQRARPSARRLLRCWTLLYGQLARARRRWYERRPVTASPPVAAGRQRRQPQRRRHAARRRWWQRWPAGWWRQASARPSCRAATPGALELPSRRWSPTVHVCSSMSHAAGDEPLMLARAVPGASVVVGADRYTSGRHAETALGATVHLLDDGFQHVQLARDLDIVVTPAGALAADHVLPKGRLREPVDALSRASVLVVVGGDDGTAADEARRYGVPQVCSARRQLGAPVALHGGVPPAGARVVALAGIGQPAQFAAGLAAAGWQVVATSAFGDHHWFTRRRPRRGGDDGRRATTPGASLTTDKDAVRLEPLRRAALRRRPRAAHARHPAVERDRRRGGRRPGRRSRRPAADRRADAAMKAFPAARSNSRPCAACAPSSGSCRRALARAPGRRRWARCSTWSTRRTAGWRSPTCRSAFRRGPRPSAGPSPAGCSSTSACCWSSCCASAGCRRRRCAGRSRSTARSACAPPTPRAAACCSSPATSASGSCTRSCTRCSSSRSACWPGRSTTPACTSCWRPCASAPATA